MTGEALRMLKQGVNAEVISVRLEEYCVPKVVKVKPVERKQVAARPRATDKMRVAGMGNIHFAFPKQVRVYITPEGKLEVRLTNRTRMKKEHELIAME